MTPSTNLSSRFSALAAGAALVVTVAGGGAAVAAGLARDSVESRHIKDDTIRSVDIADRSVTGRDVDEDTLGTVPLADAASTADTALTAGHAETAERLLGLIRGSVSAAGELRTVDSGIVDVTQPVPGRYVLTLGAPHLGCFLVPSVAHNGTTPAVGFASAWRTPPLQETLGRKVTVETHAADGDSTPDPLPFTLVVVC